MSYRFKPLKIDIMEAMRILCRDCGIDSLTEGYILKRMKCEGLSFATVKLPKLAKAILHSLELGRFQCPYTDFAKKGALLEIFYGLLSRIFRKDGQLRQNCCYNSVWRIRQICEYIYKLAFDFSDDQKKSAENKYIQIERSLPSGYVDMSPFRVLVRKNLTTHYGIEKAELHDVYQHSRPRFGPGAFYGSEKLSVPFSVYKKLPADEVGTCNKRQRPSSGYFKPYPDSPTNVVLVEESRECSVLFVPKDSRGPRVISKEPLHLLRSQLSFFDWMADTLERKTFGRINFADQEINRVLAREGSMTRKWATLDLSDASDRISYHLVKNLFRFCPAVYHFVTHERSTHATLPSGSTVQLRKLSGMGSGLTFPILALLCHAAVTTAITQETYFHGTYKDAMKLVYVYGDDIICPREFYDAALRGITELGLVVNLDKSFHTGHFRESCGGDYYKGHDVKPVRLRLAGAGLLPVSHYKNGLIEVRPHQGSNPCFHSAVLQLERHCRELKACGLWNLAEYYYSQIEKAVGELPPVYGSSAVIGRLVLTPNSIPENISADCLRPVPVRTNIGEAYCPYRFLAEKFVRIDAELSWIFNDPESPYGEVAIPRRVKLTRSQVDWFGLTSSQA